MNVFDLRQQLIDDCAAYTRSFFQVADARIRDDERQVTFRFRCMQSVCTACPAPMAGVIYRGARSPSVTSRVNVERLRLVDLPEIAGLWRYSWRWLRVDSMLDESILREKARE